MPKKRKNKDMFDDMLSIMDDPMDALDSVMDQLDKLLDDNDKKLDREMNKLDKKLLDVARKLKTEKRRDHELSFKDDKGNTVRVEYDDGNNFKIETDGDLDAKLMKEIKRRIKNGPLRPSKPKPPKFRPEHFVDPRTRENTIEFWTRDWKGERKIPLDYNDDSRVVVSGGGMFSRKYTVEVDGVVVYMKTMEKLLQDDLLRIRYIEGFTDKEKSLLKKILVGLDKLGISEPHHKDALSHL